MSALVVLVFCGTVLPVSASGEESIGDWNQFRGSTRRAEVEPSWAPTSWPPALQRGWSREVGRAHASPVIAGGRAFAFTRVGESERAEAIDLQTGEVLWSEEVEVDFGVNEYAKDHGKWPRATAAVAEGRLFTLGMAGDFTCRDTESGEVVWARSPQPGLEKGKLYCGTSCSPLLMGDAVVVQVGDDRGGEVWCRSAADGTQRWSVKTEGPGYASPALIESAGELQVVTLTERRVIGIAAEAGVLRWAFDFPDEWNENIVTPLAAGGHVVFGGVRRGTFALDPQPGEEGWSAELAWSKREVPLYMSSPIEWGGWIVGYSNRRRGHVVALDPATGEVQSELDGGWGDHATILAAGDTVLVQGTDGTMRVLRKEGEELVVHRSYELAETATWSHPVPVDGGFLLQDVEKLTRWCFTAPTAGEEGEDGSGGG